MMQEKNSPLKTLIIVVIILLVCSLLAFGLIKLRNKPQTRAPQDNAPLVNVMPVSPAPLSLSIRSQGRLQSQQQVTLASEVTGKVVWLAPRFQEGRRLAKGTLLARIDDTDYKAAVAQAKANLANAQLAQAEEEARHRQAAEDWQALLETTGDDSAEPQSELVLREPQKQQAKAQVAAARAALAQAQKNLANTRIQLPYDAVIDSRRIALGQFVTIGTAVANVLGGKLEVRLPLTAEQIRYLGDDGNTGPVSLSQVGEKTALWTAGQSYLDNNYEPDTQVRYLTATLSPGQSPQPTPGLFVQAEIQGKTVDNSVELPVSALHDGRYVYLLGSDSTLERREVRVLRRSGEQIIIDQGLGEGDQVVTTVLKLMTPGMKVKLNQPEASQGAKSTL